MENIEKRHYKSLDLFKFIFAICVVMIHTRPFLIFSEKINWFISNSVFNLAVPFFFITSSFLLFSKLKEVEERKEKIQIAKKYILHILKMYLLWSLIWLPFKILGLYTSGKLNLVGLKEYLISFFLTGGTGDAMWYLLATLFSAVIVLFVSLNNYKRLIHLTIIASIIYLIGVLISSYYKIFSSISLVNWYFNIFRVVDNGLFEGLIFFSIGALIAIYPPKEIKTKTLWAIFLVSFVILFTEVILVYSLKLNFNGICELFTLPIVSALLFLAVKNTDLKGENKKYSLLRDYSTLIYLSHGLIIRVLSIVFNVLEIKTNYCLLFLLTLCLSLAFAILIRYLSKTKNVKLFKFLY